jgi:hypothetical protein
VAHSPAAKGVGESQFQRLEKRLALCLLCDSGYKGWKENKIFLHRFITGTEASWGDFQEKEHFNELIQGADDKLGQFLDQGI